MSASQLDIDVAIENGSWPEGAEDWARRAVGAATDGAAPVFAGPAELSILLTDDAAQRRLNAQWRGKDASTNVLSFPQIAPLAPLSGMIGDISLAFGTLEREALEQSTPFEQHFIHLVVHGFLHILGYDHETDEDALVMEGLETQILARLGIADPYAEID